MNKKILKILASPCCKKSLSIKVSRTLSCVVNAAEDEVVQGVLTCAACGKDYPIFDGIPRLCLELQREEEGALLLLKKKNDIDIIPVSTVPGNEGISEQIERIVRNKISIPAGASRYLKDRIENEISFRVCDCEKQDKYINTLTTYYKGPFYRILEIGGGQGGLAKCLNNTLSLDLYVMVDIDLEWAHVAQLRNPRANIIRGDATNLPIKNGCFDVVISQSMLEHISDYDMALHEMCRVTGAVVFVLWGPNKYSIYDFGHLDAPVTLFPNNIAKRVALFWHKVRNTGRAKESIFSELDSTFYISTLHVKRLLRNYGRVYNVFSEFCMNSLKSEYAYRGRNVERLLGYIPFFSRCMFKLLEFFRIEPLCYYILIRQREDG